MAFNRWDWLERLQRESAISVAVRYVAEQVAAEDLTHWPPRVAAAAGPHYRRFAELLEPGSRRPALAAYQQAIKRARWDLAREFDAIDFYERNHHLEEACPDPRNQVASDLIRDYILESFFRLMEQTEYRVKRADVLVGVDQLERLIERVWLSN